MAIFPTIHGDLIVPDDIGSTVQTNRFAQAKQVFYSANIPISHPQLRNLLSSPEPHIVNYASNLAIYQHNLRTNQLHRIASLPAKVRCMASGYGFICAGVGEKGVFVLITIESPKVTDNGITWGKNEYTAGTPVLKMFDYGEHILNSVTIDIIKGNSSLQIRDDVVAVMTSNDHTVRFFSLTQQIESACLDLDFPVNHASISPDGTKLVAVGDYQRAYFFEKWPISEHDSRVSTSRYASNHIEWLELRIVDLYVAKETKVIGYFATAWSPSSKYCAVGSECGYITVFEMDKLLNHFMEANIIPAGEVPIFVTPSSRPDIDHGPGSIRAITFSPGPYDLLIWMESQGRICIADIRTGLITRQVIHLDWTKCGVYITPSIHDRSSSQDDVDDEESTASAPTHQRLGGADIFLATIASRRRLGSPLSRTILSRQETIGIGHDEHGIISGNNNNNHHINTSGNNNSSSGNNNNIGSSNTSNSSNISTNSDSSSLNNINDMNTTARSLLASNEDRQELENELFANSITEPPERFQYTGQLSSYERLLMDELSSSQLPRTVTYVRGHPNTYTSTVTTRRLSRPSRYGSEYATVMDFEPVRSLDTVEYETPRSAIKQSYEYEDSDCGFENISAIDRARLRAKRLREAGKLSSEAARQIHARTSGMESEIHGERLTGLALTPDSKVVFVGSVRGFYQLKLNLQSRQFFPAVEMK